MPDSDPPRIPLRSEIIRLFLAILIAPLAIPLIALIVGLLAGNVPSAGNLYRYTFFIIGIPYTFVVGMLVGLPIYLLFRYLSLRAWWHYALAGFIGGFAFADYAGPGWPSYGAIALFGFYGVVTAWVAWAIAVRRWKRDRVEVEGLNA